MPKTALLPTPVAKSVIVSAALVCCQYCTSPTSSMPVATNAPPTMPTKSAYTARSGSMRERATMRGRTRKSIAGMPIVVRASISWDTFMVPSWAA